MSLKQIILCTILLSLHGAHSTNTIKKITDDVFFKMTVSNDYNIIFFTKENCPLCEAMEKELLSVQGELEKTLSAAMGKIYNSNLVHVYSPSKEPALVFFRYGVPLLYLGEVTGELILHNFIENKEPTVKELNDDNFEPLTQASTGSTTGDWFIMFYSKTCPVSRAMTASWEAVGATLRTKMNVARVNIDSPGFHTGKRFAVSYTPSFVLLHHAYMYKFKSEKLDADSLLDFAKNFRQLPSIRIPMPTRPTNCVLRSVAEFLEGNDWLIETGLFGIVLGLVGAIFLKYIDGKDRNEDGDDEEELGHEKLH